MAKDTFIGVKGIAKRAMKRRLPNSESSKKLNTIAEKLEEEENTSDNSDDRKNRVLNSIVDL